MSFSSKKRRKAKKNPVEEESGFGQHVRFDTSNAKLLGKRLQCSISELHTCHEKIEKKEAKLRNDSHYRSKTLPELRVKRGGLIKDIPKTHEELGNILKCVPDELQTEPKQRNFASLGHATNRTKQRTHLTDLTREHGHDTSDMLSCTDCWRKDQQIIHLQDQLQRHERNENRRKCPQCDIKEAEVSSLQDQEKYLQRQIDDMKEKANARIKQLEAQIRATSSQIDGLQQSFQKERREKEDALTRLSSLASSKLRDNNPNITDLSDQNRPTKIAEKMSELYDNEWTEAFDSLEQSMDETDIIKSLFGVLKEVFKTCKTLAWNDFFKKIQADMYPHIKEEHQEPLSDHFKQQVKEYRKLRAPRMVKHLAEVVFNRIPQNTLPKKSREIMAYFEKCLEVSWLAAVQDPPLALNFNPGEKFDTALFKDYTKRGPYVEFLVWPALHLHEAGPLLTKGVAQGCQHNPYDRRRVIPSDQSFTPQNKQPQFNEEIRDADRQIYSRPVSSTKQNPNHSATFYQGTTRSGDRYNTGEHHKTMQPGRLGHQGYRDTQI